MRSLLLAWTFVAARADTCDNTCGYAYDGDCDDGQPGSDYSICACGTDCSDCGSRASCDTSGTNDWGTGNGWCSSDLDDHVGDTSTASACWTMCENTYADLVAIDWTPDGECWCQNDCQCMEDADDGNIHLITRSDVVSLPNTCVSACPAEEAAFESCVSKQGRLDDEYFGDDDCGGGGDYFLATGGQSCDDACASSGGCDLAAITAAAASTSACGSVLDDLGVSYANGPSGYYDDNSGCTTHPGQGGWAQVYWNPTCDEVNSDGNRQRVCACNCGTPGGGGDDDDDDDDFSPNTCADVQEWLSTGECADGPSVCRAEYDAWVECHYEDMAQSFLGFTCDLSCSAPTCLGRTACDWDGSPCAVDEFCNFDGVLYGSCEKCSDEDHCDRGLPSEGEADCKACCSLGNEKSNRDNAMLLIIIIVCSVVGGCCLLAISTAVIYSFGGCPCFAKRKKKRMPARVAEPSSSAASAPVPLAVAEYVAAPPPMSPGTFAKTQEHIRRTAALMAEAPPSPGPPPLAPIKATETLPAEMP